MIVEVKGHKIELFDSAEALPIKRFNKLNKYIMIGSEVGSSFEDYDQRTVKALAFLQKGMVQEAIQELNNRRQAVFNAFNEYDPKNRAFAVLVKKIDNVEYNDISSSGLDKVLENLDNIGLSAYKSFSIMSQLKKKSKLN